MATLTWTAQAAITGDSDNSWGVAKNWDAERTPADGDSVVIPNANAGGWAPINVPTVTLTDLTIGQLGFTGGNITVTGAFTWNVGEIDNAAITVAGTGRVTGADATGAQPLLNSSTLTITGSLSVTGGQLITATGAVVTALGTLLLSSAGFATSGGVAAAIAFHGVVTTSGPCRLGDLVTVTHFPGAVLDLSSGSVLTVGADSILSLDGGTVTGAGTLAADSTPTGGPGGQIVVNTPTSLPNLTLAANGEVVPPATAGKTAVLTVTDTLKWTGGTLTGHLALADAARGTISGSAWQEGQLDNAGVLTVTSSSTWNFDGDQNPAFHNTGRITFSGTGGTSSNTTTPCTNSGLIEKVGTGKCVLDVDIVSSGNIAVAAGTLALSYAIITATAGALTLAGTTLADEGGGALVLSGGTAGGVLAGHGTVEVKVTNGGWMEPSATGITITGDYAQTSQGNIAIPAGTFSAAPLALHGLNPAALNGSIWSLA